VRINWYNGRITEGRQIVEELIGSKLDWGDAGARRWFDHGGCVLVGSEGVLRLTEHNASFELLPAEKFAGLQGPPRSLPRSPGHEREWLAACRGGEPAMGHFGYSGPLTEFVLLSNVATQFAEPLEFDPVAFRFTNHAGADAAARREYRSGWEL
jgi:hypothetical protein